MDLKENQKDVINMNQKIQKLKITNYKKKIISNYSFLNIKDVFHGVEDTSNTNFSKSAINSKDVEIKEFSIYDSINNVYINEDKKYKEAFDYFRGNLKIFNNDENIIFNIKYNNEQFRILCPFSQFILNFDKINHFDKSIIIYDENLTKIISIFRMEYCFEVSIISNVSN